MPPRDMRMTDAGREALRGLLEAARFEMLPLDGAIDQSKHLPAGAQVAVTSDPEQGMGPTIELSAALARRGFDVIPHLSARLTRDRTDLLTHLEILEGAGVTRALVVGGVTDSPGEYPDAVALMEAIAGVGSSLLQMGIGGYPEGHHVIPDEPIRQSLAEKVPLASWVTTQICFDPQRIGAWVREQRSLGLGLPVWVGIPGVADLTGLMSVGLRIGAGRSLQFMFEHPGLVARLARPGGRRSTALVAALGDMAADGRLDAAGFHVFTFNQVAKVERWRKGLLRRLV